MSASCSLARGPARRARGAPRGGGLRHPARSASSMMPRLRAAARSRAPAVVQPNASAVRRATPSCPTPDVSTMSIVDDTPPHRKMASCVARATPPSAPRRRRRPHVRPLVGRCRRRLVAQAEPRAVGRIAVEPPDDDRAGPINSPVRLDERRRPRPVGQRYMRGLPPTIAKMTGRRPVAEARRRSKADCGRTAGATRPEKPTRPGRRRRAAVAAQ